MRYILFLSSCLLHLCQSQSTLGPSVGESELRLLQNLNRRVDAARLQYDKKSKEYAQLIQIQKMISQLAVEVNNIDRYENLYFLRENIRNVTALLKPWLRVKTTTEAAIRSNEKNTSSENDATSRVALADKGRKLGYLKSKRQSNEDVSVAAMRTLVQKNFRHRPSRQEQADLRSMIESSLFLMKAEQLQLGAKIRTRATTEKQ